jgi:tetratricopeptide (TPR) repeat protein
MPLKDSYATLMAQAKFLQDQGQLDEAFELYQRVLKRLSKVSNETLKKREDLQEHLTRAGVAGIAIPRGKGDYATALEMIDMLQQTYLAEEIDILPYMRAQILADSGRVDEAIALLHTMAGQPDVTTERLLDYGLEALWCKRPEDTLRFLEGIDTSALQADDAEADEEGDERPNVRAATWFMRFRALAELGRVEEAEDAWNQARQLSSDSPPDNVEIVEMFLKSENYEKALHYADSEIDLFRRGWLRGIVAEKSGKHDWAMDEWWRVAREKCDADSKGFPAWIECALRQGDMKRVDTMIKAGMDEYPRSARLILYRGLQLILSDEIDTGLQWLRAVATAEHASRFNRLRFTHETDRLLIEQTISDPELRQTALDALFTPPNYDEDVPQTGDDEADEGEE